jgi:hypothetical protein
MVRSVITTAVAAPVVTSSAHVHHASRPARAFMVTLSLTVFVVAVILDAVYALYNRRSAEGKAWAAGFWAALIMMIGIFNTINVLDHHWLILPAALGAWVGTTGIILFDTRRPAVAPR